MKLQFNKITWYSQLATFIVFTIIVPILGFYIFVQYEKTFNIFGTQIEAYQY